MNARDKIAHQLGLFFINGVEAEDRIKELEQQVAALGQRLHEAAADNRERTGAVPADDANRGS